LCGWLVGIGECGVVVIGVVGLDGECCYGEYVECCGVDE